jgi:ketosteroid isomerase-like protein
MLRAMHREILAANQAFYDAFRNEDALAMEAVWAHRAPVACIHPGWAALVGRERVMSSWRAIMSSGAPPIRCAAPRVHVLGDVAYVLCDEIVGGGRLVATNIFIHEDGQWLLVHHHAGPVAASEDEDGPEDSDPDDDDDGSPPPGGLN